MDYFHSASGKARLAVVKYRATVPQKKGTLFVNPGAIGATYQCFDENPYIEAVRWTRGIWC